MKAGYCGPYLSSAVDRRELAGFKSAKTSSDPVTFLEYDINGYTRKLVISPKNGLRDGRLYNAMGGSGLRSALADRQISTQISDWILHTIAWLLAIWCGHEALQAPTTQLLVQLSAATHRSASCRAQQDADRQHYMHWNRHLLANIGKVTDVELVIGASAVMFNPHFLHFIPRFPPVPTGVHLGAAAR